LLLRSNFSIGKIVEILKCNAGNDYFGVKMRIDRTSLLLVLFIITITSPLLRSDLVSNFSAYSHQPIVLVKNGYPVHNLNTSIDYPTIQSAIDANETEDGHVILIDAGIYYEHVHVSKNLTLIGENKDNTIIDGDGTGKVVQLSTRANVTGFTIRNGDYGVWVRPGFGYTPTYVGFVLNDNYIVNNNYGGIHFERCGGNTLTNNVVANNTLFGIHLYHAGNNTISNNTVLNNGHGIDFYGNSNDNTLRNNNMTDNEYNFGLILRGETRDFFYASPSKPGIVNDVDPSNTVNGKPIYYLVNRSSQQVPSDVGYIWLNNCTNILINGCNLSNNLQGILLLFANNVSIVNNNITENTYGIYVGIYSSNNTIIGNTLEDNLNGIYLGDLSRFTTMRTNSISGGQMNFGVSPDIGRHLKDAPDVINDIDTSNTVDGKPIIYWINQHDRQVPANAGYVMLINSTNILIEGSNLSNNVQNIFLLASNNTVIANNSITNSIYGIDVRDYGWFDYNTSVYHRFYSFNATVKRSMLVDNGVGIRIRSDNSTISNNTLYRNPLGIYLARTSNSTISRNVVLASDLNTTNPGPELYIFYYPEWPWERSRELAQLQIGGIIVGGNNNVVHGNTVTDSLWGISMCDNIGHNMGTKNVIFHNNLINNTGYQAINWRGNYWDNDYPAGGNYWRNYNGTDFYSGPYRNETGSDGIGDTPFEVLSVYVFEEDHYPLMAPINIFDAGIWNGTSCNIAVISNSTISNFQLNKTQKTIDFNVIGETGIGFCRVTIPNVIVEDFWQDNYTVLVNGQPVESRNWTDEDNTYIYFTYQHSTQKITIIPEFPSNIVLALLMTLSLITCFLAKRKFVEP
jgi:parallel beta-helix repeat protein